MNHVKSARILVQMAVVTFVLFAGWVIPASGFMISGYAWDEGPGTSRYGIFRQPGGATWSIMPAGVGILWYVDNVDHPPGDVSTDIDALIGGILGDGLEISLINAAFDVWAAVSGFMNLGMVADDGLKGGEGFFGDIRIGAFESIAGYLAHSFQPGDDAIDGDIHMSNEVKWVDDPDDKKWGKQYDFFTVILHEIGHALGLKHSDRKKSVMYPVYSGARRALHISDIRAIKAIYGRPQNSAETESIPEPGSILLLGSGLGALFAFRFFGKK